MITLCNHYSLNSALKCIVEDFRGRSGQVPARGRERERERERERQTQIPIRTHTYACTCVLYYSPVPMLASKSK